MKQVSKVLKLVLSLSQGFLSIFFSEPKLYRDVSPDVKSIVIKNFNYNLQRSY